MDNLVLVHAAPRATCVLRADGMSDSTRSPEYSADDDGVVTVRFRPTSLGAVTRASLDCLDEKGASVTHAIEMVATNDDVPSLAPPAVKGPMRPPLEGDPSALSNQELAARGYPMRPDPVQSPEAYSAWLNIVSRPMIAVSVKPVASRSGRRNAVWSTANWAGYAALRQPNWISQAQGPFPAIVGQWNVPAVTGDNSGVANASVQWIGIGIFNGTDLTGRRVNAGGMWQAGTYQDVATGAGGSFPQYGIWYELVTPTGCGCCPEIIWPNGGAPVNAGDQILAQLTLVDSTGAPAITGSDTTQYLSYYIANITQGYYLANDGHSEAPFTASARITSLGFTWNATTCAANMNGNSAEWIVETPQINNNPVQYAHLADFGYAEMDIAQSFDMHSWSWRYYGAEFPTQIFACADTACTHRLAIANQLDNISIINYWWVNFF